MAETIPIFIPCEVFDVVLSADDHGPTDMEKAVLLFLAARDGSKLEDVLGFLGLGERLTMDLITKLWQLGYVLVDANQGKVRLEPYWKSLVEKEEWIAIRSSHQVSETVSLMRDLISGQVMADISTSATPLSQSSAPILISSTLAEGVSQVELAGIAMRNLRSGTALARRSRSVRAAIRRPDTAEAHGRNVGWLRMEFEASADPEVPGSLTLRAAHSEDIARARIAPGIERALTAWALENAEHPAVIKLVKIAVGERRRNGASLIGRIEALASRIVAGMADPLAHQAAMQLWTSEISALGGEVEALEFARGRVVLHTGAEGVPSFMKRAEAFEHQLVLSAPTVDYDGLLGLDQTLLRRLRDLPVDASAVILWGGPGQRQLPNQCAAYLANAEAETAVSHVRRIFSGQRSSRVASAVAVMDGRRALYASASPLDSIAVGQDFSFVLEIIAEPPSPIPRRLLEIARERAPDFAAAEQIDLTAWQRGRPREIPTELSGAMEAALGGAPPDPPLLNPDDSDAALVLNAYFHDLRQACGHLAERAVGAGSTIDILSGASLYQYGLDIVADADPLTEEKTLWLGFGRDESAYTGVSLHRNLATAVGERVKRGLPTIVLAAPLTVQQRPGERRRGGGVDISALRLLGERSPELVTIVDAPDLPGHFVCGEVRFVTAPGGLASPPIVQSARLGSRSVGIGVTDPELCEAFRAAIVARWPALAAQHRAFTSHHRSEAAPEPASVVGLVEAWRKAPLGRRRADLMAAMIQAGGETSSCVVRATRALLDLTLRSEAQDSAARDLRSDTLAVAAAHGPTDVADAALTELAEQAWREGRWHEVALIVEAAAEAAPRVPAALAAAAAATNVGLPAPDLSAFLVHDDLDRWLAGVAVAVKAVLFNADEGMASALEIKLLDPIPAGAEQLEVLAKAVLAYWSATLEAIDPATIRAISRKDTVEEGLRTIARAFVSDFQQAAHRKYNNAMLNRVVPRIYSDVSGLKPVVEMIAENGGASWPAVLKGLGGALGSGRVDVVKLADELFEKSRRAFGLNLDEKIAKGRGVGAGIHEQARDVLRRALVLRDAIDAALTAPERATSTAMRDLLSVLRSHVLGLASIEQNLPPDAIAAPLLLDLRDHLSQMLGE